MSQIENNDQETKSKAFKEKVISDLYEQAEAQLVKAIEINTENINKLQASLQQAQADKIALNAQLSLIRKVNERAEATLKNNEKQETSNNQN